MANILKKAVFLDRDGVINRVVRRDGRPYPPPSLDALEILPGVPEAIKALRREGFMIIVVTNQPDVATGIQHLEVVESIHAYLHEVLEIDEIKVCYHVDANDCRCRKPKPGMLLDAATDWSLDLKQSYLVGDRWRDIVAGKNAGCKSILIESGYDEQKAKDPDAVVASLQEASELILTGRI